MRDVLEHEDGPLMSGPLGGGWDEPEDFACRGPEIARERLGLAPTDHVRAVAGAEEG